LILLSCRSPLAWRTSVIVNADSTISVDPVKGENGQLKKFEEVAPFLYREVHGQDHVGFKKDSAGHWQFQLDYPFFVFQKVGLFENKFFNMGLLIFGLVVLVSRSYCGPCLPWSEKHYDKKLEYSPSESRLRLLVRTVCILLLVFFVGWFAVLSLTDDPRTLTVCPWIIMFGI